ncbi:DNA polymerase III subunit delta [Glaciecola sp. 1036]|uniref:DNA polymerase III subunit delta n=1 Tax=Alteromonadaceae TaxID=72275 RepID=UPI003D01C7DD
MQLNVQSSLQKIQSEALPPIFLLFGDEPQQKLDVMDALRKQAVEQGYTERHKFTADSDFNWHQLAETAQTMSLFADRQYIELELPTGKPGTTGSKALIEYSESASEDVFLLIHGPQIGQDVKNSKWFKQLSTQSWFCPCYQLKDNQLNAWIRQYAQQLSLQLGPNEASIIAEMSEGNLLATKQELDKLSLAYANQTLTEKMILDALVEQSKFTVFQLVDEVLLGNIDKALKILQQLESEGVEPNAILWNLINENQRLLDCKQQAATGKIQFAKLKIWPSRQGLYSAALNRLDENALMLMQKHLQQADVLLKSQTPPKPFVILAHLMLLFLPVNLSSLELL